MFLCTPSENSNETLPPRVTRLHALNPDGRTKGWRRVTPCLMIRRDRSYRARQLDCLTCYTWDLPRRQVR